MASDSQGPRTQHITGKFTGKVCNVFQLIRRRPATANPGPALSHLPVDGQHGTAWGRQGQRRKTAGGCASLQRLLAAVRAVPHAQLLTAGCKSQLCRSTPAQSPQHSCDPPREQSYVRRAADRELQPPKHLPLRRTDTPFWIDSEDQPPNPAPVKSTRALP